MRAVRIEDRPVPIESPHLRKAGGQVADELGGRYLLRYLRPDQVGQYVRGSSEHHWVTPTPYAPEETISWLFLKPPLEPRPFVMLLNPARIPEIFGPKWVKLGKGIEYYLPKGFPRDSIVGGWELEVG